MPVINHGRFSCSFCLQKGNFCFNFIYTVGIAEVLISLCVDSTSTSDLFLHYFSEQGCPQLIHALHLEHWWLAQRVNQGSWENLGTIDSFDRFLAMPFMFRYLLMSFFIDNLQIQNPNYISWLQSSSSSLKGNQRRQDMTGLAFLPDSHLCSTLRLSP